MAKSTTKTYKQTVWRFCATYVKLRDADKMGFCLCCTCTKVMPYNDPECQAGHFIPGHNNTTYFDTSIIHAQCTDCNLGGAGMHWRYGQFMKKKYGHTDEILEEMQTWRHKTKKVTLDELKELKKWFDDESNKLRKEKGLL